MTTLKRTLLIVVGIVIAGGFWFGWSFYRQHLTGIGPAILPSSGDIADLIDRNETPLVVPQGFSLDIFATDLGGPRVLVEDPNGVLIASVPSRGQIVALPDRDGDGNADETIVLADAMHHAHGLAFRCVDGACRLYVAEEDMLSYYDYDAANVKFSGRTDLVKLPTGGNHVTRSLLYLPEEDRILVAIGSTCNVCREEDPLRAAISVIEPDGNELKPYATGLRNSVFQTIHPTTGQVWATEMGRDLLGDDTPPDEINVIVEGGSYGWPNCYADNAHDTDFDTNTYVRNPCEAQFETPSRINIPAHSAPLGLAFVTGDGWPAEYADNLFVAYHGSWNRSVPTGYKVVRYQLDADGYLLAVDDFVSGWLLPDDTALGRPTGLLVKSDGQLFIADDKAGVIYRVHPTE
ncbi:PQQ-dependent sugar dehydrogenase [Patescibacteria group bacterium]|nr:PQQ-dependent sugar dehydrogenase [Patescibacteria group bacterium]